MQSLRTFFLALYLLYKMYMVCSTMDYTHYCTSSSQHYHNADTSTSVDVFILSLKGTNVDGFFSCFVQNPTAHPGGQTVTPFNINY
jgi:hypothetical protein